MKAKHKIDTVVCIGLIACAGSMLWADIIPPTPTTKRCPGGYGNVNGVPYTYPSHHCWSWQDCGVSITVNTETGAVTAVGICVDPA